MSMRILLFVLLYAVSVNLLAQNKDTANISITNFTLHPGTFSWRGTGTFHNMTSFNSSAYGEGHMRQNGQYRMNYRLLPPVGHNANYEPGYPLIVMLHGAGERGNCWNGNCYCSTDGCNPNDNPIPGTDVRFLNNDHNLAHGGNPHLTARNLAGNKLPDDPTLAPRAFPGFVLFPQMTNQWRNSSSPGASDLSNAIRLIRLLCKQYNIDQDRIYIHGLSMGGQAVLEALNFADWLFAAAAPMSALSFQGSLEYDSVKNIPIWFFQGGRDNNPKPSQTETTIRNLREKGANVRYTLYPTLGHGTWNAAYAEPDFFSWLLSKRKSNIHVDFDNPNICGTTGAGARLELPQGFLAYQWERDGVVIPGATQHTYLATFPGIYRARFSRKSNNPTEVEWNRWSDPVSVGEKSPVAPIVEQIGTVVLDDLNGNRDAYLVAPENFVSYSWYRNGSLYTNFNELLVLDEPNRFRIKGCTANPDCPKSGAWTLVTQGFDGCPSLPSKPKHLVMGTHNTGVVQPAIQNRPDQLTAEIKSPSSVVLRWNDNSKDERAFEIWRRRYYNLPGENNNSGWVLAALTEEDQTLFVDSGLEPGATYWYKIRAVNNKGRSIYHPQNSTNAGTNNHLYVTMPGENILPTPPTDLQAKTVAVSTIQLNWSASSDASGIKQYYIYYHNDSVATNSADTSYVINLPINNVYNFRVKAQDFADNLSFPSNPSQAHTFVTGLYYKHTTGVWPNYFAEPSMIQSWETPEFTGWVPNFTLDERTQDDFFNFEFDGYLYITTPGTYRFRINSDDGHQLYINNTLVFSRNTNGETTSGNIVLPVGPVPIMVRYYENAGGQSLAVRYSLNGAGFSLIPTSVLRSGTPPALPIPPATPTNLVATATGMQTIDLSWDPKLTIVVLGSSTAFGTGATPIENSWVNLFNSWINTNTPGANVINRALGGYNSTHILPGGDATRNITYALSLKPDIIIVNLPSNDVAANIPLATTLANLQTVKNLADAQGVKIFFTTTQPRNFNGDVVKQQQLQQSADDIRAAFGEYVIDIYDELTNLPNFTIKAIYNSGDGIHVNNAGHNYIFTEVRDKLIPHLSTVFNFEVQRATSETGPFFALTQTQSLSFNDTGLIPGSTYYYRVRTTAADTVSAYTAVASATTFADAIPPTQPGIPNVHKLSFAAVSFNWNASTDNVGLKGYEVYANGIYIGFSPANAYQAVGLLPGTQYNFHVVALDLNDNASPPSPIRSVTTPSGEFFYTKPGATALNLLASWENGLGNSPASFEHNGQFFYAQHPLPVNNPWTVDGAVSKVVIDDNVTITVGANPVYSRIEIPGNGTLNLNHAHIPELYSLSPSSTVNYGTKFIQLASYGNLGLTTSGAYTFPSGTIPVQGNLTAVAGVSLKGAATNLTTVQLGGNLTMNGAPAALANSFGINLELTGNGTQTIQTGGALELFKITKTGTGSVNVANGGTPVTLNLGSSSGGGVSMPAGRNLNIGNNTLAILGAATINSNNETGTISVNDGEIRLISSATANSNLYFNPAANTAHTYFQNLSGGAVTQVQSMLNISDGLKIQRGTLNANGNITLLSNSTKTANLQEIENGGAILGDVRVQRYISNKARTYRYISSSVEGVTVNNWQQYFAITGTFPGASTGAGLSITPSLYVQEPEGWVGYPLTTNPSPYNDNQAPIEKGRGYTAFIRNNTPLTVLTTGVPHQGNVVYQMFPPQPGDDGQSWNLLGNPYASTIAWNNNPEAWIKNGSVGNIVAVRNNFNTTTGQFQYWDAVTGLGTGEGGVLTGGRIAPGQAFWIQATGSNPSMTITEKAKSTGQQDLFREGSSPFSHLRLALKRGSTTDETLVILTDFGTDDFDPNYDALKMDNDGTVNFSTFTANDFAVAINNVKDEFCSKQIGLNLLKTTPGTYTLSVESPETLFGVGTIRLVDHFTSTTTEIAESTDYTFSVTSDPASFAKERLEIVIDRPELDLSTESTASLMCEDNAQIHLSKTQPGATYTIFNHSSEALAVSQKSIGEDLYFSIPVSQLQNGINNLKVQTAFNGCSAAFLPSTITVEYLEAPVINFADVSVCVGSPATLTVTASNAHVVSYEWYDASGKIKGVSTSAMETDPVFQEAIYQVAPVLANGCLGTKNTIKVTTESLEVPELLFANDTLFTNTAGAEYSWSYNGAQTATTSMPFYVPKVSGSYLVGVKKGGCLQLSSPVVVTMAEDNVAELMLQLYPNPTSSGNIKIKVLSPDHGEVKVRITDILGKEQSSSTYPYYEVKDEVIVKTRNELRAGVYFLVVEQNTEIRKVRFIIEE